MDAIKDLGFDARSAVDAGEFIRVEGDIILAKASLTAKVDTGRSAPRPRVSYQWRTDTLVSAAKIKAIKVDLSGISSQSAWTTAARAAMTEWNSINGSSIRFVEGTPADISLSFYSTDPNLFAVATFPSSNPGVPGSTIRINTSFSGNTSSSAKVMVLVHELGHTIGFRHTNWQQLGETQYPGGATLISGTPQTDGNSVMNGGTAGAEWNGFSAYDKTAARNTYPGISISIHNPSNATLTVTKAGTYTWTSTVSGGTGSYTYQWARDYYDTGSYSLLGMSSSQPLAITCHDNDYGVILRLTVTDTNGATKTADWFEPVAIGGLSCS